MGLHPEDFKSFIYTICDIWPQQLTTPCNTETTVPVGPREALSCWYLLLGFARCWEQVSHECPTD